MSETNGTAAPPERLPVIYCAGAYRAPTPWQILRNIQRAREVSLQIWKLGAVALCPHANTALFDGEADDAIWLAGDLELLRRCDAIIMVQGWQKSSGATAEWTFAKDLDMPIFLEANGYRGDDDRILLKEWINAWKIARRAAPGRPPAPGAYDFYTGGGPRDDGGSP